VEVGVDPVGPDQESYIEDCPVCCRPWNVWVSREGEEVQVRLGRDDE
jgi:hypothetical protein